MFSQCFRSRTIAACLALGAGLGMVGHGHAAPLTGSPLSADVAMPNLFPLSGLKPTIAEEAARKDSAAAPRCDARCAAEAEAARTGAMGVFGSVAGFRTDTAGPAQAQSAAARPGRGWTVMNAFPIGTNEDGSVRWQGAEGSSAPIASLPGSVTYSGPAAPSLAEGGLYLSSVRPNDRSAGYTIPTTGLGSVGTVASPVVGGGVSLPNLATPLKTGRALSAAFVEAGALNRLEPLTSTAVAPYHTAGHDVEDILADSIGGAAVAQNIALAAAIPSSNRFGGDLDRLTKVLFGMVLEPATLSLFGLGLGAAAFLGRRRRS